MIYNNCSEKVILAFINKSTEFDSQLLHNLFSSSNDIIKLEIVKKIFEFSMHVLFHFIKSYKLFDKSSNEEFKKIATDKMVASISSSTEGDLQLLYELFTITNYVIKLTIVEKISKLTIHKLLDFFESFKLFEESSNEEYKMIAIANMKKENIIQLFKLFKNPSDNVKIQVIKNSNIENIKTIRKLFENPSDNVSVAFFQKFGRPIVNGKYMNASGSNLLSLSSIFESLNLLEDLSDEVKIIAINKIIKEDIFKLYKLFKNPSDDVKIQVINNCEEHQIDTIKELFENPSDKVLTAFFEKFGEYITNNKIPASFFK